MDQERSKKKKRTHSQQGMQRHDALELLGALVEKLRCLPNTLIWRGVEDGETSLFQLLRGRHLLLLLSRHFFSSSLLVFVSTCSIPQKLIQSSSPTLLRTQPCNTRLLWTQGMSKNSLSLSSLRRQAFTMRCNVAKWYCNHYTLWNTMNSLLWILTIHSRSFFVVVVFLCVLFFSFLCQSKLVAHTNSSLKYLFVQASVDCNVEENPLFCSRESKKKKNLS